jgi:alkylhydroperoxidase family enzyme
MARGEPVGSHPDPKVSLAIAFAQSVLQNRGAIDDPAFNVLKEEFSDEEIAELCAFICFKTAFQMFGALLKLEAGKPTG